MLDRRIGKVSVNDSQHGKTVANNHSEQGMIVMTVKTIETLVQTLHSACGALDVFGNGGQCLRFFNVGHQGRLRSEAIDTFYGLTVNNMSTKITENDF
jgi:hypothetical protein